MYTGIHIEGYFKKKPYVDGQHVLKDFITHHDKNVDEISSFNVKNSFPFPGYYIYFYFRDTNFFATECFPLPQ